MPRRLVVAAGLAWIPFLRIAAWALLFASVWITVLGLPLPVEARIQAGTLPRWIHVVPPAVFGCFVLAFGVYRFTLVRKGRYNAGKAFVQFGLAVLVLTWVGSTCVQRYQAAPITLPAPVALMPLLESTDPAVRAVACEALAARGGGEEAGELARRLADEDPDPRVRSACARVP
ncbi:MAG: HEAT repeat domain-containing protein [Deltaproteobacteria bacterium]|nr:HEAT repeat domain-containing protein [Deltaproteobacteria bacterium]